MYINISEDDFIKKSLHQFILNKNSEGSDEFKRGVNRALNMIIDSTNHYYDPVALFLPYDKDFLNKNLDTSQVLLKKLQNKGKYRLTILHIDSGLGEAFLTKEEARERLQDYLSDEKSHLSEGVEFSTRTLTVYISELAEYIKEKTLIERFGCEWQKKLQENYKIN
tara:strand:- start:134 stop:631 length:498 start_codon:yes stop_codon:yes gene_type:complete